MNPNLLIQPYSRGYRFHTFFHQIDNFKSDCFLWVTAGGIESANQKTGPAAALPEELEGGGEEEEDPEGGEG